MTPDVVFPPPVPAASVRRLPVAAAQTAAPQPVVVPVLPAPIVVPRQIDPVGLRLMALQLENEQLRAELDQLRAG